MNVHVVCVALLALHVDARVGRNPPKVQLYSRNPGELGTANVLICHVSQFHPPDITIELLRDGGHLLDSQQTDLAFNKNWHFHLTRSAPFTPQEGARFTCRVSHGDKLSDYVWDINM